MNEKLIIKNFGPIKDIEITLNKVNLFIGPQSSGKSTIAKIVSFCQWLEKSVIVNQGKQHIDGDFLAGQLIAYHGFEGYTSSDSYIFYESDLIIFEYHSTEDFSIKLKDGFEEAGMHKVAYIPSERNIVSIPNLSTLSLENKYTRQFIFDWLRIRNKYGNNHRLSILDLGVDYFYGSPKGDTIVLEDGKTIQLSVASSGLQALVPMLIYINYVTEWIYNNEDDISFDKYTLLQKTVLSTIPRKDNAKDKFSNEEIELVLKNKKIRQSLNDILKQLASSPEINPFNELFNRIAKPHSTKLTIEESEMNVFPTTQYNLIKYIFSSMDFTRGDTLLLTTHSPYIMTSINNLIQANNASLEPDADVERLTKVVPRKSWMSYTDVNAWAIERGYITSINDDEAQLISTDDLDRASDIISDEFNQLL